MTLNDVLVLILRYFTEFGSFRGALRKSGWKCRRKKIAISSRDEFVADSRHSEEAVASRSAGPASHEKSRALTESRDEQPCRLFWRVFTCVLRATAAVKSISTTQRNEPLIDWCVDADWSTLVDSCAPHCHRRFKCAGARCHGNKTANLSLRCAQGFI